mgnify:CR=1 FL=1
MSNWKRFTEADQDTRKAYDNHRKDGQWFVIIWDEAPEKPYHTCYLGSLGGSGHYADILDVLNLPNVRSDHIVDANKMIDSDDQDVRHGKELKDVNNNG